MTAPVASGCPRPDGFISIPARSVHGLTALALAVVMASCTGTAEPVRQTMSDAPEAVDLSVIETLAVFTDARDLAIGPDNTIFVTDAGTHTLSILSNRDGRRHGGPGTREGQFDEPVSVDPTNGLVILVADAGNGRIQRFSREFRPLGTISVDASAFEQSARPPSGNVEQRQRSGSEQGRPVSVVTSNSNEVFAIDAAAASVLKWDARLGPEQIIGGFGSRDGRLVDPLALATDGNRFLFVLDPGQSAVVVFDLFGTFLRRLAVGLAGDGRSITVSGDRILVTLPRAIYSYELGGTMIGVFRSGLEEDLVDAHPLGDTILLLTREYLLSAIPAQDTVQLP